MHDDMGVFFSFIVIIDVIVRNSDFEDIFRLIILFSWKNVTCHKFEKRLTTPHKSTDAHFIHNYFL